MRIVISLLAIAGLQGLHAQIPIAAPHGLKPLAEQKLPFSSHATGAQVYRWDGATLMLTGPDAALFDQTGRRIGTHFAGPTWQTRDGSRVTAKPAANASVDSNSIPWLLLTAVDHSGSRAMENVRSIERLPTAGGKAPASGCDAAHKGEMRRARYTADYYFYGAAK